MLKVLFLFFLITCSITLANYITFLFTHKHKDD